MLKVNDYENKDLFHEKYRELYLDIFDNVDNKKKAKEIICYINDGNGDTPKALSIIENTKELEFIISKYNIDKRHAIYDLIARSTRTIELPIFYENRVNSILSHSYINKYEISGNNTINIDTEYGQYEFHQVVNKNNSINSLTALKRYLLFHSSNLTGKCHEIAVQHCNGFNCVTGVVNSLFNDVGVVHSWVEDDIMAYDINHNFAMKINEYYKLNDVELMSSISSDKVFEDLKKLKGLSLDVRDYLVNYESFCKQYKL
jgi:hypothetical protein